VGDSNGANLAASLILLHPRYLASAALFRAMAPQVPDLIRDFSRLSVFIGAARLDPLIPSGQAEELAALFKSGGADVTISGTRVVASSGTMTFKPPNIGCLAKTFDEKSPPRLGRDAAPASETKEERIYDSEKQTQPTRAGFFLSRTVRW
jgi:hypothetical protein